MNPIRQTELAKANNLQWDAKFPNLDKGISWSTGDRDIHNQLIH